MLTADQLSAICAKYGACSHDALQEAARMGAAMSDRLTELERQVRELQTWRDQYVNSMQRTPFPNPLGNGIGPAW
jgi:hypothetical protein